MKRVKRLSLICVLLLLINKPSFAEGDCPGEVIRRFVPDVECPYEGEKITREKLFVIMCMNHANAKMKEEGRRTLEMELSPGRRTTIEVEMPYTQPQIDMPAGSWIAPFQYRICKADLSGAKLDRMNLSGADFSGANLKDANLFGSVLTGANLTDANLSGTELHRADLRNADLRKANLRDANLVGADLRKANLSYTNIAGIKLSQLNLSEVNLSGNKLVGIDLSGKDLFGAMLKGVDLTRANLEGANLERAKLNDASLVEANLVNANLKQAQLHRVDLEGVNMREANLDGAFLLEVNWTSVKENPNIDEIVNARFLETLRYSNPASLYRLRIALKENGLRQQEREITYVLKHGELWGEGDDYATAIGDMVRYVLFELTTAWGLKPHLALFTLLWCIPIFSLAYTVALLGSRSDGIWKVWDRERIRQDLGKSEPVLLQQKTLLYAIPTALYFSVLSAFHIGWRDFNVGNWISRLQAREYVLKSTGWVRTVSGVQSLLSVYLLAMFILTYFGRPFE